MRNNIKYADNKAIKNLHVYDEDWLCMKEDMESIRESSISDLVIHTILTREKTSYIVPLIKIVLKSGKKTLTTLSDDVNINAVKALDFKTITKIQMVMPKRKYSLDRVKNTTKQIHSITRQLIFGLNYIHSKGIIHGDIKAHNILVNNDKCETANEARYDLVNEARYETSNEARYEYCDFGNSYISNDIKGWISTCPAPECVDEYECDGHNTMKSDVWCLGKCLLYSYLKLEFDRETKVHNHIKDVRDRVLQNILSDMLVKREQNRLNTNQLISKYYSGHISRSVTEKDYWNTEIMSELISNLIECEINTKITTYIAEILTTYIKSSRKWKNTIKADIILLNQQTIHCVVMLVLNIIKNKSFTALNKTKRITIEDSITAAFRDIAGRILEISNSTKTEEEIIEFLRLYHDKHNTDIVFKKKTIKRQI